MLYIFAGLPGTGKSTLATHLAAERKAVLLRIDSIEQAARDGGDDSRRSRGIHRRSSRRCG